MMQAAFSLVVNGSVLYVCANLAQSVKLNPWDYAGTAVVLFGFLWEAIGDYQLLKFKQNPENKGKIITHGLYQYSRHPNYFGECVIWWGFYLFACGQPKGYYTIFSAIFINLLLKYVSGVAMLERKQMKNPDFVQYSKRVTTPLFPWFPKQESDGYQKIPAEDKKE